MTWSVREVEKSVCHRVVVALVIVYCVVVTQQAGWPLRHSQRLSLVPFIACQVTSALWSIAWLQKCVCQCPRSQTQVKTSRSTRLPTGRVGRLTDGFATHVVFSSATWYASTISLQTLTTFMRHCNLTEIRRTLTGHLILHSQDWQCKARLEVAFPLTS